MCVCVCVCVCVCKDNGKSRGTIDAVRNNELHTVNE